MDDESLHRSADGSPPLPTENHIRHHYPSPDYSHSLVASVAVDEPDPEVVSTGEAGSAVAGAGWEPSSGRSRGNKVYVLILYTYSAS